MKSLAIVIPCKNEALRLNQSAILDAVSSMKNLSILFVDDGSTDCTAAIIAHLAGLSSSIDALYLPENCGKAEATRRGVLHLLSNTTTDLIGFWDADLAVPLNEAVKFVDEFERDDSLELAIGSRWPHLGSQIDRRLLRGIAGNLMKSMIRLFLNAPVYDTQCGAKIMTRKLASKLFGKPFISRWLFDIELLKRMGLELRTHAIELPLGAYHDIEGSKMTLADAFFSLFDLFRIAVATKSVKW